MKRRNVTITMDEETARWARVEAARRDSSVSRFVGEVLRERMKDSEEYEAARARYFSQEPGVHRGKGQPLPRREELYDRRGLRGTG
jgi:hypothetical protein